jgi:hypothetical protein
MKISLKYYLKLIAALTMLLLAMPSFSGDRLNKISSDEDLDSFVLTYYQHPQPELISPAIQYIGSNKFLSKHEELALPIASFFSILFSTNPASRSEWKTLIEKQDEKTENILLKAIDHSPEQLAEQASNGMAKNDYLLVRIFREWRNLICGQNY